MRHLARDLRYAWRGLLRAPIFTFVALASIALGIGANTAIFTLVDRVLMRPLPVASPDRLVLISGPAGRNHYGASVGSSVLSFPMYEDLRGAFIGESTRVSAPLVGTDARQPAAPVLSGVFARYGTWMNVRAAGQTERVPAELVSGTYFPVLGVGAAAGRVLTAEDDRRPGEHPVVVLGYDYWRTHFGGDPRVVGTTIHVNDYPLTIVGVAARGFQGVDLGFVPSLHVPLTMKLHLMPDTYAFDNRRARWANVFGRLQPGVTIDRAKAALQPFFHALLEAEVREPAFRNASAAVREQFVQGQLDVQPASQGRTGLRRQLAQPLWSLMSMVAAVLLVGEPITIAGYRGSSRDDMVVRTLAVSPGYFATLGMTLVHGRDFDARDARYDPPPPRGTPAPDPYRVAIVNESFARHYLGASGAEAIGRRIGLGLDPGTPTPIEIVGVVRDTKYTGVRDEVPRQLFLPLLEHTYVDRAVMYIRTSAPPSNLIAAARDIVTQIDRRVSLYNTRTLAEQAERSVLNERLVATLSTAFGTLATLLALVGLYGVMAYTVARRTREIGVRMALGAAAREVVWLVMREVLVLVASGVTVGLAAAWMLGRFVQSQLYEIPAHDVLTMAGAALLLTAVALGAGYMPAWRATRVNPVRALRSE